MKGFLSIVFFLIGSFSFAQVSTEDCDFMKSASRFIEKGDDSSLTYYVVRDGMWFYEFSEAGKKYIKSKMEWLPDCTYRLTMVETNIPNFDLSTGTMLHVKITAVLGNEVSYQYLPEDVLPSGVLIIEE